MSSDYFHRVTAETSTRMWINNPSGTEMEKGIAANWSTAQELIEADHAVVSRIDVETPQSVIDELIDKFDDFRKAYCEDALLVEEYAEYGPVQLFRNAFLKGWYLLLAEVSARRQFNAL